MKKQSQKTAAIPRRANQDAHWAALTKLKDLEAANLEYVEANLHLVSLEASVLYLADGDTRVWVENDTLLGLRFTSIGYPRGSAPASESRFGEAVELSPCSIARLRDDIEDSFNTPESKRIQKAVASIMALVENPANAGNHPVVRTIESHALA
jgi:hypothetical protein